jgi:hypothetical protein
MRERQGVNIFESIPDFFFDYSPGAIPIGSTDQSPDEYEIIRYMKHALEHDYRLPCQKIKLLILLFVKVTPIRRDLRLAEE